MSVDSVPSPCTRSCCLDRDDICIGCGRHLREITGWQAAADSEKRLIIQLASERLELKRQERAKIYTTSVHTIPKQAPE